MAFDSVGYSFVRKAMIEQGIQKKYVGLLAKLKNNSQAKIRTERNGEYSSPERRVKQGVPLSPKLFATRKLDWDSE